MLEGHSILVRSGRFPPLTLMCDTDFRAGFQRVYPGSPVCLPLPPPPPLGKAPFICTFKNARSLINMITES